MPVGRASRRAVASPLRAERRRSGNLQRDGAEAAPHAQVVRDGQAATEQQRSAAREERPAEQQARRQGARRHRDAARDRRQAGGRRALLRCDDRSGERLPGRHVDLGERMAQRQQCRGEPEARRDGHGQQEHVGDEVWHEHGLQETSSTGERGSKCLAERRQQVRGEEQQAQLGSGGAVPLLEPEGQDGLHGQPAGEGVDGEQRCQAERGPGGGSLAESLLVRCRAHRYGAARLDRRGEPAGEGAGQHGDAGVDRERRVPRLDVGEQCQSGRGEAAERPRQQGCHGVAGEECGVAVVRARLGEDRLLDPAERGVVVGRR